MVTRSSLRDSDSARQTSHSFRIALNAAACSPLECESLCDTAYDLPESLEHLPMNRFFLGNFDFEEQLRGEVQRPVRLERLVLELASSWLAIADASDRIWCPGRLPGEFLTSLVQWGLPADLFVAETRHIPAGLELVPWGWSPAAVEFGERNGLVVNAPPLDVVRLANSREYSVPLEEPPTDDWSYGTLCRKLGEVLACIERLPPSTSWVIKANWSHAARERILGRGPVISNSEIQWVKQRIARDGVVSWELWLQREAEIGIQWEIPSSGQAPQLVAITELLVDTRGQYAGTRQLPPNVAFFSEKGRPFSEKKATPEDWAREAAEATRPVINDLAQRGYFGPVGIDAMRYFDPEFEISRTRTLQDINARWTMGRLAAGWFERLRVERPVTWSHGPLPVLDAATGSVEPIATSPGQIDNIPVAHRTWLK